ncbi:MAG: metal-dependent hydrolase [Candidatus Paceibacterota bacterium]|jgi:membrane-bound metal-dependent hydrolase YbcI (DUF457 family)
MPRRRTHADTALFIIFLIWLASDFKNPDSISVINSISFLLGSILPDILEPPYHFSHRGFFHSWKMLGIVAISIIISMIIANIIWSIFKSDILFPVITLFIGYAIHLLLDSTSKMGLPKE